MVPQPAPGSPAGSGQCPTPLLPPRPVPRRPQLPALTHLRPGQDSPSPLPPPRSLRSRSGQPHLVFTSGLRSSPHPLGPADAPGHPELPLSLCGAVLAASLLRFSASPVVLCLRTPALPGQPGGRAASGRGEGGRRGWKSNTPGKAAALPSPPLLPALYREGKRGRVESKSAHGAHVV